MIERSNSARAPSIWKIIWPPAVLVSNPSDRLRKQSLRVIVPRVIELFDRIRVGCDPAQSTRTHPGNHGSNHDR